MRCFYCNERGDQLYLTIDHVYPRWLLRQLTKTQRANLKPDFHELNKVQCCSTCNSTKGRLHPLDWLVIMPHPARAMRLAELLIKIGEDTAEVFSALQRRRVKVDPKPIRHSRRSKGRIRRRDQESVPPEGEEDAS